MENACPPSASIQLAVALKTGRGCWCLTFTIISGFRAVIFLLRRDRWWVEMEKQHGGQEFLNAA